MQPPLIISASRRTDLPAYYAGWLMGRFRAGCCVAVNPFNAAQRRTVSLLPADVDCVFFWTRDPLPLLPFLPELDASGIRSLFHFSLTPYGAPLERDARGLGERIDAFLALARAVGPDRACFRYDPVVFGGGWGLDSHAEAFARIARELEGSCFRARTSFLDSYAASDARLARLPGGPYCAPSPEEAAALGAVLAREAAGAGMSLASCAEPEGMAPDLPRGACVDAGWVRDVYGIEVAVGRDGGQRADCLCAKSVDIGAYGTCPRGCSYCYARRSAGSAERGAERDAERGAERFLSAFDAGSEGFG